MERWGSWFREGLASLGLSGSSGDAANAGSVGVHTALGFEHTGVLKSAGWKFGRWLDVVLMQRTLGLGDSVDAAA